MNLEASQHMLRIVSVFDSIDGEVNIAGAGATTRFIRLAGCNLRCWRNHATINGCDTPQSWSMLTHPVQSVGSLITGLQDWPGKITITGGEPLLQEGSLFELCKGARRNLITIETNGSLRPSDQFRAAGMENVRWVMDYKMPSTGHFDDMIDIKESADFLNRGDFVKMVVADHEDLTAAIDVAKMFRSYGFRGRIAVGPVHGVLDPQVVVERLLVRDALVAEVYLNVQLHKYIWPNATKEV